MKKSTKELLKVLSTIGATGSCIGIGFGLLKIYGTYLTKVGITEEFADEHPVKTVILALLGFGLILVAPALILFDLIFKAEDWLEKKINGIREDKHIDMTEKDEFEQ